MPCATACRCSASASACSCCSRAPRSTRAPRASACCGGDVRRLEAGGLKLPHIGWNLVRFRASRRRSPRACPTPAPSTTCTPSRRGPPTRTTCSAPASTASASRASSRRGAPVRRPVPPREVLRARAAAARELRARVRAGRGVILYPAIDILDGKAVRLRQGDFDDKTVYDDDPLERGARLGRGGRALPARRRPRRRARRRAREPRTTCGRSPRRPGSRCSTAAACARCPTSATRCARAPSA